MFPEIKKSGLTIIEFAGLIGVTRIAVHNWIARRSKPHTLIKDRVASAREFLVKLIDNGKLPMGGELTRVQRNEKIEKLKKAFDTFCSA